MEPSLEKTESEDSVTIRPIDASTVHKICSGQVVLSLAVAVKELVENSLDAGATRVDVRLKNYGVDSIEVSDNGGGVVEDNFAALTLKYHTSKLSDYSDLLGVSSFGFRGEALSSLCALSDLVVTTRHKSAECATTIEYDNKGNIKKKTLCSRQVGTTVTLTNLFSSLPVRQKELHKNAKREFTRMTQLLYAYCLISVGVKITCTNQTKTSPTSIVVATQGSTSYKDNIACIFGAKQLQTLMEIKPQPPSIKENVFKGLTNDSQGTDETVDIDDVDIDLSEESNDADTSNVNSSQNDDVLSCSQVSAKSQGHKNNTLPFDLQGYISTCAHGSGRSTTDKQFYFVNSRPCEPTKVMKLVNEVYRQFNPHQYPFVFINLKLDQSGVDVNVTPDKRKVFLTKEKIVLDIIKGSLMKLYENIPSTLKIEIPENLKQKQETKKEIPEIEQPQVFNTFLKNFASNMTKTNPCSNFINEAKDKPNGEMKRKSTTMLDFVNKKSMKFAPKDEDITRDELNEHDEVLEENNTDTIIRGVSISEDIPIYSINKTIVNEINCNDDVSVNFKSEQNNYSFDKSELEVPNDNKEVMFLEFTDGMPNTQIRKVNEVVSEHTTVCKTPSKKPRDVICDLQKMSKKVLTDKEDLGKHSRKSITMKTSLEHVTALSEIYNTQRKKTKPERMKFKSEINPVFNKKCEEELQKEISKDSFKKMEIIGQFNLGFIITCLDDDLFIVDQHATDEIYNFETLQKTTELSSQKLVLPQQLDLTGVNEQILMDNLPVFTKNGFAFEIDRYAPPTKRVKLLSIPMSKNWIFGKDDIEELLFMLREAPTEHCRPSRVRAMFASRACRKSVMIGTALSKSDMKKLVEHMAQIDKPWNCPHGRPTIRHLVNLAMVHTE